jgi:hypothetical protein
MYNTTVKEIYKRVYSNVSYIIFFVAILISSSLYLLKFYSYISLTISAAIGSLIFIKFDKSSIEGNSIFSFDLLEIELRRLQLVTSILFFVFFGLSLLELLHGFYTKTILYYICISLCAGLIGTEILLVPNEKEGIFNLIKSFLLVLNITLSNQLLYRNGISLPDLEHQFYSMVMPIVNYGHIPAVTYQYFPAHHILAASNILICNSDPKMTYLYLGGFIISAGLFFVFIIGKKFLNLQFGLFAALLYTCLDYLIMYGSHPIHQSYNYFLSIVLFTIILSVFHNRTPEYIILYLLVTTSMVFTHHLSAMIVLVLLCSIATFEFFFSDNSNESHINCLTLARLFAVILFGQWIYYSSLFGSFAGILMAYSDAFAHSAQNIIAPTAYDQIPMHTIVINSLGSCILITFSVIGFLSFIRKLSFLHRITIVSSIVMSVLLGIGIVFHQVALLPDRIYPFLQLFGLVFLASGGVLWILNGKIVQKQKLKFIYLIFLIVCLSFFSCSSTIAGFETSPFVGDKMSYYKLYNTPQETLSQDWISKYIGKEFNAQFNLPISDTGQFEIEKLSRNSIVVLDKFYFITGFSKDIGRHMGQHVFIRISESEGNKFLGFDKYYDNRMINVFHIQ